MFVFVKDNFRKKIKKKFFNRLEGLLKSRVSCEATMIPYISKDIYILYQSSHRAGKILEAKGMLCLDCISPLLPEVHFASYVYSECQYKLIS